MEFTPLEPDDDLTEPLPLEVRQAYLAVYSQPALEARKLHYEREALFERDKSTREALTGEVERSQQEIDRRKLVAGEEAEGLFTL